LNAAKMRAAQFSGKTLTIKALTAEEGKLYGSIGPSDIVRAAQAAGMELKKAEVDMPTGPIRQIGSSPVTLRLHTEVEATLTVVVEEEKAA
jgi:large subunit ribosomal protein L9